MEIKDIDIFKRSFLAHTRHHSLAGTIHPESRVLSIKSTPLMHNEGETYIQKNVHIACSTDNSSPHRVSWGKLPLGVRIVKVRASNCVADEGSTQDLCASIEVTAPVQHSFGEEIALRSSTSPITLKIPILTCTISERVSPGQPRSSKGDVFSTKFRRVHQSSRIPNRPTTSHTFQVLSPLLPVVKRNEVVNCTGMHGGTQSGVASETGWKPRRMWFIDLTQLSGQGNTVLVDQTTGRILAPTALKCQYKTFSLRNDINLASPRSACEASNKSKYPHYHQGKNDTVVKKRRVVFLNDVLSLDHLIQENEVEGGDCMSAEIPELSFKLVSINLRRRPYRE